MENNFLSKDIAIIACLNHEFYDYDNLPESFKIWAINGMFRRLKKYDLIFDMHDWETCEYKVPEYYDDLKKQRYSPVVKPSRDSRLMGDQIIYPIDGIIQNYGLNLKNSIPEAVILAVWYNDIFDKIIKNVYIYGCGSGEFTKYPEMGFSLYETIGFARGRGINVFFVTGYAMDDDDDIYGFYQLTNNRIKE